MHLANWIGKRAIPKYQTPLKVNGEVVDPCNEFRIYDVKSVRQNSVFLAHGTIGGWIEASDVVLYEDAIDYFSAEIRRDPSNWSAYSTRGLLWTNRGEYDKAIADYNEIIHIAPDSPWGYLARGFTWIHKKQFDNAIQDFEEAIGKAPKDFRLYNNLAWIFATCPEPKFRDGKRAVELATEACEMSEWEYAFCLDTLAAAYAECGDFNKAIPLQEKANILYPDEENKRKGNERLSLYHQAKPYRI